MKLGQNVCLDAILDELKNGSCRVKPRSLGQILEKHCSLMLCHTIQKAQVSDSRAVMALLFNSVIDAQRGHHKFLSQSAKFSQTFSETGRKALVNFVMTGCGGCGLPVTKTRTNRALE